LVLTQPALSSSASRRPSEILERLLAIGSDRRQLANSVKSQAPASAPLAGVPEPAAADGPDFCICHPVDLSGASRLGDGSRSNGGLPRALAFAQFRRGGERRKTRKGAHSRAASCIGSAALLEASMPAPLLSRLSGYPDSGG
jgi:hypothetical protein